MTLCVYHLLSEGSVRLSPFRFCVGHRLSYYNTISYHIHLLWVELSIAPRGVWSLSPVAVFEPSVPIFFAGDSRGNLYLDHATLLPGSNTNCSRYRPSAVVMSDRNIISNDPQHLLKLLIVFLSRTFPYISSITTWSLSLGLGIVTHSMCRWMLKWWSNLHSILTQERGARCPHLL